MAVLYTFRNGLGVLYECDHLPIYSTLVFGARPAEVLTLLLSQIHLLRKRKYDVFRAGSVPRKPISRAVPGSSSSARPPLDNVAGEHAASVSR